MQSNDCPVYPAAWGKELIRNPAGRAFWFVSRFVSRSQVEYVKDVAGKPKCFRLEREANAALLRVQEAAAGSTPLNA